jgi:RHS repeat-associated protein
VDSGSTLTEAYNALGWRVEASNASGVVDYLHDAAGEMIGGSLTGGSNQYIYFRGGLMAQYWNGASFAHLNGLGSTQQFTDWTGANPVDTLFYPWGQPVNSSVESLWAGFNDGNGWLLHEWQTDTRRYTPSAGRWFTPDPLGGDVTNPQSLNRYAYVLNNPTSLTDPTGLVTIHGPGNPPGGGGGGCDPGDPSCDPDPCDIDFVFCPGGGGGGGGGGSGPQPTPTANNGAQGNTLVSSLNCLSDQAIAALAQTLMNVLNRVLGTHYKYDTATVWNVTEGVTLNIDVIGQSMGNVPVPQNLPAGAITEPTSCTFHPDACSEFPNSIRLNIDPKLDVPSSGAPLPFPDDWGHIMYGTDASGTQITAIRIHGDVGASKGLAALAHAITFLIEQTQNGRCIEKFD